MFPMFPKVSRKMNKEIFLGSIEVTEKLDGSQFRIGLFKQELIYGSRKKEMPTDPMFDIAIEQAYRIYDIWKEEKLPEMILYAEYLKKPKHNTLQYERVPKNHLYLFEVLFVKDGEIVGVGSLQQIQEFAKIFDIDPPNVLYVGKALTKEKLQEYVDRESYLGGTKQEGIVIRSREYTYPSPPNPPIFNLFPLRAKLVREDFMELNTKVHAADHAKNKTIMDKMLERYFTEARVRKAVLRLREAGKLTGTLRDIPLVINEFLDDLFEEELDDIKDFLWSFYEKRFKRKIANRVAVMYRTKILDEWR